MAQYMLSVHHDGSTPPYTSDEDMQAAFAAVDAFNEKLMANGSWVFGGGLMPLESTSMVDGRGSETVVTDGPFSESKEFLGGFWVIEVPDLETAQQVAAEGSKACGQAVEVRPFQG